MRRYLLAPRQQLLSSLQDQAKASSAEVKKLEESQESLKAGMQAIEKEVRELLNSSPALARAFANASR